MLYGLAEGLRVVSVLLLPWLPDTAERLLAALGSEDRSLDCAPVWATTAAAPPSASSGSCSPEVEPPAEAA